MSVAWYDDELDEICSYAFPFNQGMHNKPDWLEKADFGWHHWIKRTEFKNGNVRETNKKRKIGKPCSVGCDGVWPGGGCPCGYTPDEKQKLLGPDPNLPESEWYSLLAWLLRHDLVWHNALFDLLMFRDGAPFEDWYGVDLLPHTVWDTMLGQRILDPEHRLALKPTAERRFDIPPDEKDALEEHLKSRKLPPKRYDLADWSVMEPYAVQDTALGLRLARDQWYRFRDGEAKASQMHEVMDQLATLVRMEQRGIPFNSDLGLRWAEKMESRLEEMKQKLPFEPTPNGIRQFFFTLDTTPKGVPCLGLEPLKVTEKGAASTDAEVVDRLAKRDAPFAKDYREYKLTADAVTRYYRGYSEMIGKDGRLRTRFRQTGTRSGRLSCERVNLQAIPHDHRFLVAGSSLLAEAPSPRDLIYAPEGYKIWDMDLAQAELRIASLYAQCERMLEIIRLGRDPHGETAIALGLSDPDKPDWKAMRSIGKRANFSLIFGVGHVTFRADLQTTTGIDLGVTATQKLIRDWNALYPEFKRMIHKEMDMAEIRGWTQIRGPLRRYYTDLEKRYQDYHKAFNQRVQGNQGEFSKAWMVEADQYLMEQGLDEFTEGLLLQVHDSLIVMTPDTPEGDAMAHHCAQIGRDLWPRWFNGVPGGVDITLWGGKG